MREIVAVLVPAVLLGVALGAILARTVDAKEFGYKGRVNMTLVGSKKGAQVHRFEDEDATCYVVIGSISGYSSGATVAIDCVPVDR